MSRLDVRAEIKRLDGGFQSKEIHVERPGWKSVPPATGRGVFTWVATTDVHIVSARVIEVAGISIDFELYLKLLKVFRQTKVYTVDVMPMPGGVEISFDRAWFFLRRVEAMDEDNRCIRCGEYSGAASLCHACEKKALKRRPRKPKRKKEEPVHAEEAKTEAGGPA